MREALGRAVLLRAVAMVSSMMPFDAQKAWVDVLGAVSQPGAARGCRLVSSWVMVALTLDLCARVCTVEDLV